MKTRELITVITMAKMTIMSFGKTMIIIIPGVTVGKEKMTLLAILILTKIVGHPEIF